MVKEIIGAIFNLDIQRPLTMALFGILLMKLMEQVISQIIIL